MRALAAIARASFLQILQYRMRYVTGILTYLVYVSAYAFLWRGIYGDAASLKGFTAADMTAFIALGWIFRSFTFNNIDREVAAEVREGRIAVQLLRPVAYPVAKLVGALGECAFRAVGFTLPIALAVGWAFDVPGPAGAAAAAACAASVLLGFLVMAGLNFLVSLAAFPLKHVEGLLYAKHMAVLLLSGLLVPLSFFPERAARALEALPFAAVSQAPVLLYLGRLPAAGTLASQAVWAVLLWGLSAWLWERSVARLTVQGG